MGPSQGIKVYEESGTDANGEFIYSNTTKTPPTPTQLPASLPDIRKTIWIGAVAWGAATVSVYASPDSVNWFLIPDPDGNTSWTANVCFNYWAAGNPYIKTVVTGATGETEDLSVTFTFGM